MNRQIALLGVLGVIVLVVAFYMLGFKPKQDEIAELEVQLEEAIAAEAQLDSRIRNLQEVRERAPEIEAALVTGEGIVPRSASLPAALRQLQLAADDSGTTLLSVNPARPAGVADPATPELAQIALTVQVDGSYFQLVDFLRRIEDAAITPRGIKWIDLSLSLSEYPTLSASLTGRMYALLPEPLPAVVVEEPADVEVDVTVEEDAA